MIKYIVKGDLEKRAIEPQYFYNKNTPIEAREEALSYFINLVEILKDSNENFIANDEFIYKGTKFSIKKKLGVELVCVLNNEELTIDFYGEWRAGSPSDIIAFDLT